MIALSRGMGGGSEGAKKSIQASLWAQFGVFLFHIGCRVSKPPRKLRIAALFCGVLDHAPAGRCKGLRVRQ